MPSSECPPFDPNATLDEFAGVGKNRRFDQKIDDAEDEEIQVIYKRGDKELPLAKPSRAVYFGDRVVYDQEATRLSSGIMWPILFSDPSGVFKSYAGALVIKSRR